MSNITVEGKLRLRIKNTGREVAYGPESFDFQFSHSEEENMGPQLVYFTKFYIDPEDASSDESDDEEGVIEFDCELYEYPIGSYNHHHFNFPDGIEVLEDSISIHITPDREDAGEPDDF